MSPIVRMYQAHETVLEYLGDRAQISHHSTLQITLPKVLLLAAASEFEERVCETLRNHVREHTSDPKLLELVDQKAIRRQYHTLFDWEAKTAGKFWSLFGSSFKSGMKAHCQSDETLTKEISSFLEMGNLRNEMVHNNHANFRLEKTLREVYELYQEGDRFVTRLPSLLRMSFEVPLSG